MPGGSPQETFHRGLQLHHRQGKTSSTSPALPPSQDLTVAYNVTQLTSLTAQLKDATDAKLYGER